MTFKEIINIDISFNNSRLSIKKRYEFFNNLSVLISTGVQIKEAIQIIAEELKHDKNLKILLDNLSNDLIHGKSLSESLKKSKKFSNYEVYSLKLGEETGMLAQSLINLAEYSKSNLDLKRKVISSLSYPVIILFTAIIAVVFMLNFVVPMFTDIFQRFGKELPQITQIIISLSHNMKYYILILVIFFGLLFTLHRSLKSNKEYMSFLYIVILKIPVVGNLLRKINLAKFTSAMELFVNSGIPIAKAINLMQEMIGFYPLRNALHNVEIAIIDGDSFHEAMKKESLFDNRMVAMIKVGTEVNKLGLIFNKLKLNYNEEVIYQASILNSFVEPIMIIFIGVIISLILVAMYLPIFQLSNTFSM